MKYSYAINKIARILRANPERLKEFCVCMERLCKKGGVLEQVIAENDFRVKEILGVLKLKRDSTSEKVYKAIISKLKKDDKKLFDILGRPICTTKKNCGSLIKTAIELSGIKKGLFLKKEKAYEILCNHPPKRILEVLNYKNTEKLLQKEDFREVYAALRFVESPEWMISFLTEGYKLISPLDFEERNIEVLVLQGKWLKVAKKFIEKKYHNVSHLKELGIIFIIPLRIDTVGETIRVFTLLLHYLHEIDFYSRLFRKYTKEENFNKKLASALRGDVLEKKLSKSNWRIVQRYLAKDNENDFRLFEPHVNPEAIHWDKAEVDLSRLDAFYPDLDFTFWKDLNYVGDFFQASKKIKNSRHRIVNGNGITYDLVSMNLIDNVMSLVKKKEMIKYLYHHQESLWNKIFEAYVGKENLEKLIIENFDKGFISQKEIKNLKKG